MTMFTFHEREEVCINTNLAYLKKESEIYLVRIEKLRMIYENNGLTKDESNRLINLSKSSNSTQEQTEIVTLVLKLDIPDNGKKNDFDHQWQNIFA